MDPSISFLATFAATRALHVTACLLLLGVWVFDRAIVRTGAQPPTVTATAAWRRIATTLLLISWPLALISAAGWFVSVAMSMTELPLTQAMRWENVKVVATQTSFGHAWLLHSALLIVAGATANVWRRISNARRRVEMAWTNLALTAAVTAGIAWAGHGATGPAPAWHRVADVLHLLIAAAWPGGLLPLLLLLGTASRSAPSASELTTQVRRFSALSLTSVTLLTATGVVNSWCLLGSFGALWTTPYGRLLLVKLLLFSSMILLGAFNLLVLKPQLINDSPTPSISIDRIIRRLRLSVAIELSLAAIILIAIGLLGLLPPPRI